VACSDSTLVVAKCRRIGGAPYYTHPVLGLVRNAPLYHLQRELGTGWCLPWAYTVSVLSGCNARCRTCGIHRLPDRRLSLEACAQLGRGLRRPAGWLTVSGGEPFLRDDLAAVVDRLVEGLRPRLVNIPTNGSFPEAVERVVGHLVRRHPRQQFIVNVSVDGVGDEHDVLRGLPGSYDSACETLAVLRALAGRTPNLVVGIHSVISSFNVERFPAICDTLLALRPDSLVAEVAENRVELANETLAIAPDAEGFARAVAHLQRRTRGRPSPRLARLVRWLRRAYHDDVGRWLRGGTMGRPCFAGTASCHVMPDGTVLACGVRGAVLGELERFDYDLAALWRGPQARRTRREIARQRCSCPLANQAYVNAALDPRTPLRLLRLSLVDTWRAWQHRPPPATTEHTP
jgi:MoaA/NifB/PqqE/SkfB family radical SAM enzyme